jgi:hypothetical protein
MTLPITVDNLVVAKVHYPFAYEFYYVGIRVIAVLNVVTALFGVANKLKVPVEIVASNTPNVAPVLMLPY